MDPNSKQIEKELVIRLIEGDYVAFEKIYHIYVRRVYYFALRYLKNSDDTEEMVQEVFTKIWENRANLNPELSFSGYLLTITKNTIFNDNRKKVNHYSYCEYVINYLNNSARDLERTIVFKDLMEKVNQSIDNLPPKRQEIFKLSRLQGLSHKEISAKFNISEKTIETHMRLAFKDLKRDIGSLLDGII